MGKLSISSALKLQMPTQSWMMRLSTMNMQETLVLESALELEMVSALKLEVGVGVGMEGK